MAAQEFKGKLAIVTGGAKQNGIGFATACALAKGGADIVLHYNLNKEAAQNSATKIRELGVKVAVVQGDAGSLSFGDDVVRATLEAFPGRQIDIIINNAGHATFQEGTEAAVVEDFDALFHPNVRGPHLLVRAALPHIASPGGRIVNHERSLEYFDSGLGRRVGGEGITVNVVAPGPIATDYAPPEEHPLTKKFRAQQYIKRNGGAEEVANVIVFAASSGASFVSGQVLGVDGGLSYV
ncbi:hypothetical protein N7526_009289 [Penicillium atrosanguineum]|nr:hypothetical protein N7526_009289 [Penicillium atrosanguineum]